MRTAHLVHRPKAEHQIQTMQAFASGLQRHGWRTTISHQPAKCDLLMLWGVRRKDCITRQKELGGEVCILERGYTAWPQWISVSFGGQLNGRATFRGPFTDSSRFEKYLSHLLYPWKPDDGGEVIVMGQCYGDTSCGEINVRSYFPAMVNAFEKQGFKTRFRPHPREKVTVPIADDLAKARFVVTWNSISGVDAVLAGVPTVAMDQGSMVWDVAGHELTMPPKPRRAAWAHALAWKQWQMSELASGECWEIVGGGT